MFKDKNKLAYALFFVFAAAFIIIILKGLTTIQPGDENVYYQMGKLVSEGKIPYKDFFYAHPPLQVYLIALIYKIFGFNIFILKSVPLISSLVTGFFIFKIAKEKFGNVESVAASLLYFFTYGVMFNSVFSFGISIATMFLVIGIYFLWNRKNYLLSGIFFGLAGITRLLTLIPVLVILIIILVSNKKKFLRLSSGFFIIFLLTNGIFTLFFAEEYVTPVYRYHLLKSTDAGENFNEYIDIMKLNWILFSSAALFIFVRDKKAIGTFSFISIVYLIFLLALKKVFGFYFIVVFPVLALVGGYGIVRLMKLIPSRKWLFFVSIILLSIFSWNLASDILFLEKIGFTGFERGEDLTDFINSASDESTLIFGDDSIVPLLALLTDKKIAMNFLDTNPQVFTSGVRDLDDTLASLKEKDVLFVTRSKQGISHFSEVRNFLNIDCEFLSQFSDETEGNYLVHRC